MDHGIDFLTRHALFLALIDHIPSQLHPSLASLASFNMRPALISLLSSAVEWRLETAAHIIKITPCKI